MRAPLIDSSRAESQRRPSTLKACSESLVGCASFLCKCLYRRPACRLTTLHFTVTLLATLLASCVFWIMDVNGELGDDDDRIDSKDWWTKTSFVAIFGGSFLGLTSCAVVVRFYVKHRGLRTHTNTILFWRTVCDLGSAAMLFGYCIMALYKGGPSEWKSIIFADPNDTPMGDDDEVEMNWHLKNSLCDILAAFYEFVTIGAEIWFVCHSLDLSSSLDNPFVSDKANLKRYHLYAWFGATAFALGLLIPWPDGTGDREHASQRSCGAYFIGGVELDYLPVCFLSNFKTEFFTFNTMSHFVFFYIPVAAVYFYAVTVFRRTYVRFKQAGVSSTLEGRLHLLAANAVNVLVFIIYWSLFTVPYFVTYQVGMGLTLRRMGYYFISFHAPCKGFYDLVVFVITNDLSDNALKAADENSGDEPGGGAQSNKALRDEVIYNVTLGIRTAAQLAQNAAASDVASGGIANGSVWVAEANARARIIDIDPLHQAAGGEGGGVKFEALIDMVMQMLTPSEEDASADEGLRGSFEGIRASLYGGSGSGMTRRPLFESANEERLAAEYALASQYLNLSNTTRGDRSSHNNSDYHQLGRSAHELGRSSGARSGLPNGHTPRSSVSGSPGKSHFDLSDRSSSILQPPSIDQPSGWVSPQIGLEIRDSSNQQPSESASSSTTYHSSNDLAVDMKEGGMMRTERQKSAPADSNKSEDESTNAWLSNSMPLSNQSQAFAGTTPVRLSGPKVATSNRSQIRINFGANGMAERLSLNGRIEESVKVGGTSSSTTAPPQRPNSLPTNFSDLNTTLGQPAQQSSTAQADLHMLPPPPLDPPDERDQGISDFSSTARPTDGNEGTEALLDGSVSFTDFLPGTFARIRQHFGITTDTYVEEWSGAAKIKLNEGGASQAFFFYSGGQRFIAKSCTKAEMDTLLRIAGRYEEFLADNPGSLLLRILGAHCLRSYSSVFYFFVMENLFNITDEDESEEDVDSVEDSSKSSSPKSAVAQTVVNGETDVPTQVEEANVKFAIDSRGASEHDDESDDDNSERNSDTKVNRASKIDWLTGFNDQERQSIASPTNSPIKNDGTNYGANQSGERFRRSTMFRRSDSVYKHDFKVASSVLQEEYDIKGSWENRNAKRPREGKKLTCRYCNQKYRFKRRDPGVQAHLHAISVAQSGSNNSLNDDAEQANLPGGLSWLPSLQMSTTALSGTSHGAIDISDLCPERLDRQHVPKLVLKDNDLNYRLVLSPEDVAATCSQLDRDSEFLAAQGIMDYSLLIGVHNERHRVPSRFLSASSGDGKLQSAMARRQATHIEGPTVYYLGVIDILQEWTWAKRFERWAKVWLQNADRDGLSAMPPANYLPRFQRKVRDVLGYGGPGQSDVLLPGL